MKEEVRLKKKLDDHETRISRLEKLIMTGLDKGDKGLPEGKKHKAKRKKARSTSRRPGPGAMIDQLIEKDFFKKRRLMKNIIEYCKNNLAHKYKVSDFSPTLGRCIRNQKLKREKNKDGQFEYFKN